MYPVARVIGCEFETGVTKNSWLASLSKVKPPEFLLDQERQPTCWLDPGAGDRRSLSTRSGVNGDGTVCRRIELLKDTS
jgi:hypothetical protein